MKIYFTEKDNAYNLLNEICSAHTAAPFEILRTEKGKPYIDKNPFYFSISHSNNLAALAVSDEPVGLDFESFRMEKKNSFILKKLSVDERSEIENYVDFLFNWTAKESYAKYLGESVFSVLPHLEFVGGKLKLDSVPVRETITNTITHSGVLSVCCLGFQKLEIVQKFNT